MKPRNLFLISLLCLAPLAFAESELLDRVVAVVNDEAITQSEVDAFLRPLYEQYKKDYSEERLMSALSEARQKLLNQLIEDRLVYQEAKRQAIQIDAAEVERNLEEFKKHFKNDVELEDSLKKEGLTLAQMRDRLERQAMIRRLHDMEIRGKVVVSPKDVEDYYQAHPSEFSTQDRIKVRSMTIKKNDEAKEKGLMDEASKNKIEDLHRRIKTGEDFEKLSKEFSQDTQADKNGLSDWIERGAMIPAIDEVIFNMKAGELSDVIETPMGYHFFRVEERQEGKKKTLEESRDEIFEKIFREKATDRFREWMNELKRKAYISIR